MIRVLFYTGLAMLAVSALLLYLPIYFSFILIAVLAIVLIISLIFKNKIKLYGLKIMLVLLLMFAILGVYTNISIVKPAESLVGFNAQVTGTVTQRPNRYENYSAYVITTEKISVVNSKGKITPKNIPQEITIRLTDVHGSNLSVFDRVRLNVTFNSQEGYKTSNLANEIVAGGYINKLEKHLGKNRPFYAFFYDLRDSITKLLFENINYDEASVITAVLVGDHNYLDQDFITDSKMVGTTHVLVVSGGHLGIIFQLLSILFRILKVRRVPANILMLFSIFALTAVCGFSPSILRAGLTYYILVIGNLLRRNPDPLNSLGAATIIILFSNPFGVGNLSLVLSLFSTFGLIFICPIFYEKVICRISKVYTPKYITKAIVLTLCQTLSAIFATTPICILGIGYISLIAPIANLLITGAFNILTSLSFITVMLLCLPSVFKSVATIPIIIICVLVRYTVFITQKLASVPWAITATEPKYIVSVLLFLAAIILIVVLKKEGLKNKTKILIKGLSITLSLLAISTTALFYIHSPNITICSLSLGTGSCITLKKGHTVIAIGAGDSPTDYGRIEYQLLKTGTKKVDHLVIPTANRSFAAGAIEFSEKQPNTKIVYPNSGDYYSRLDYVKTQNFKCFSNKISFIVDGIEVITLKDIGCVLNFEGRSAIIFTGTGDISKLTTLCKNKKPILFIADSLPKNLPKDFSNIVLSGKSDKLAKITKVLEKDNIKYLSSEKESVVLSF